MRTQAFRYNNYLGRFHWRHLDVMDVLSGFQARARASLSDTAVLLGFPGKLGLRRLAGLGRIPARRAHAHPPLLRDRRHQHLAGLPALPAHARAADRRGPGRGAGAHARLAHRGRATALRRIPRGLERAARESATRAWPMRRVETGVVADLTHEAEGVVRGSERGRQDGVRRRRIARRARQLPPRELPPQSRRGAAGRGARAFARSA